MSGLHEDVAEYVERFYDLGLEEPYTVDPLTARQNFTRRMSSFAKDRVQVARVEDLEIPTEAGRLNARAYWPNESDTWGQIAVFFHGGGWVVGSVDTHDNYARRLCAGTGAIVISVDYRKAPEAPFPAAADDARAAITWVSRNAERFNARPDRLAVAGVSAGGNLAAVAANDAAELDVPVALQVLIYPCIDPTRLYPSMNENATGYLLSKAEMDWYNRQYSASAELETHPRRSPLFAEIRRNVAPALVVTAEFDPLRDEGNAYAGKLAAAGIDTELMCLPGTVHGFFGFGAEVESATRDIARICERVRARLVDLEDHRGVAQ